jgi:tRNA 2-selenouridine synthase
MDYDGGWQPLVYCWRGGQRSGSFASILAQIGWRVETLEGGYQSYRRLVVDRLYDAAFPAPVVLLDGNTGTAKTDILKRLPQHGVQVIDLEGLAGHRGSALGDFGDQPGQKGFESALAAEMGKLDPTRPVVLEAESSKIGAITLPPSVFAAMKEAPRIAIAAPVAARARYLTRAYADLVQDTPALEARLEKLVRLQGWETVTRWTEMARAGAHEELAAELIEGHYDPRYSKSRARSGPGAVQQTIETDGLEPGDIDRIAAKVAAQVNMRADALAPG